MGIERLTDGWYVYESQATQWQAKQVAIGNSL